MDILHSTPEKSYFEIPILNTSDLPKGSGFNYQDYSNFHKARTLFHQSIIQAIMNPSWLAIPCFNEESKLDSPLPATHFMTKRDINLLISLQKQNNLIEIAKKIDEGSFFDFPTAMADVDVIARAIEIMGQNYPNLMMFRGTSYKIDNYYIGKDFAPANLNTAFYFHDHPPIGTRIYPILAMIKFSNVGKLYSFHKLRFKSKGSWWQDAISLIFSDTNSRIDNVKIRRLPTGQDEKNWLLEYYNSNTVTL